MELHRCRSPNDACSYPTLQSLMRAWLANECRKAPLRLPPIAEYLSLLVGLLAQAGEANPHPKPISTIPDLRMNRKLLDANLSSSPHASITVASITATVHSMIDRCRSSWRGTMAAPRRCRRDPDPLRRGGA